MPIINGTASADDLVGTDAADTINGLDGDDRITGGLGADILNGDAGDDTFWFDSVMSTTQTLPWGAINGGDGFDTIDLRNVSPTQLLFDYGTEQLSVRVGSQRYTVTGVERLLFGDSNDHISASDAPGLSVSGGGGDDFFMMSESSSLFGDGGDDRFFISGAIFDETSGSIDGGSGVNLLWTNIAFTVDLQAGTASSFGSVYSVSNIQDVLVYVNGYASTVRGDGGANVLSVNADFDDGRAGVTFDGRGGDDTLLGSAGADLLYGSAGNDTLQGGAAADLLNGGSGDDLLRGDAGSDTADYSGAAAAVVVSLGTTSAQVTGGAGVDTLVSIENLAGSSYADRLTGTDYANDLSGNAGDDRLTGGAGNDTLDGGAGLDKMFGGLGNDTYIVRDATDYAYEYAGEGIDTVRSTVSLTLRSNVENLTLDGSSSIWGRGNELANVITGNDGSNKLYGMDGDDRLLGGGGNDRIEGGAGIDKMYGGVGNDTYIVSDSTDYVYENAGEGIDLVLASVGCTLRANVDRLTLTGSNAINGTGNADANVLTGNGAANVLSGLLGNDKIFAAGGDDALSGGDGVDILDGGAGRDRFFGGDGSDRFVFNDGDFGGLTASTCDQIKDFSQSDGDIIRLSAVDAEASSFGDQAFGFIGSEAFSGTAGELRFEQISGNTYVQGDTDGDGTADFWIRIDGVHALTSGDFIF